MSAEILRECECGCGRELITSPRFIKGHNAKFWVARPAVDRFWGKVAKSSGCWFWTASTNRNGYGRFSPTRRVSIGAHRFSYELAFGPIPDGLVIDHLCGQRACVRPEHLEAVTALENIRRAKPSVVLNICKRGHEFTPENTRVTKVGYRQCRTCGRMRNRGEI